MGKEDVMDTERGIRAVLDSVEKAYFEGVDAVAILDLFYETDAIVVGEGYAAALRGRPALEEQSRSVSASLGPHPEVTFTIAAPVQACGDTAVTLLSAVLRPDVPDAQAVCIRVLAGWRKGSCGWRICLEMYSEGET